ncbi:MAG: superoxide dismutase [Novosphingobium sp.]
MLTLSQLPYATDALEPAISARTLEFHHGKHHQAYISKTNDLAGPAGLADASLEAIVAAARKSANQPLFNNAAQAWNHAFYWHSMTPRPGQPAGRLEAAIKAAFGDLASLRSEFVKQGAGHFASGWLWLAVTDGGMVQLRQSHDAETLCDAGDAVPLLVCDLWEHAYYLDRQNLRQAYLEAWFDGLANWDFAARQMAAAESGNRGFAYGQDAMEAA